MLTVRLPNGWTVAGALAHVAFWDRLRLCLMLRWAAGDMCSAAYDTNLFNETMQPLLEMIPPGRPAAHEAIGLPVRSLIVHNVGEGAKVEDVLFQYEITGHYRCLPEAPGRGRRGAK